MDNDVVLNYDEIIRTLQTADVITFRFYQLDKRLLIDNRCNEIDGPMIRIVDKVASAEERFRHLRRLRPRFKLPEKLTAISWPKNISTLEQSGVWQALVCRMAESGFPSAVRDCEDVLRELKQLERKAIHDAITGDGYRTVWQRTH
jgi:hypothetical protein